MSSEAVIVRERHEARKTLTATGASGEIQCLPDGRAGVLTGLSAEGAVSGSVVNFITSGQFTVVKASGQVWVKGCRIWWDHSANAATCVPPTSDKDFFLGTACGDVASATTTGVVNLNVEPSYIVDLNRSAFGTTVVKTAGTPAIQSRGGNVTAEFSATAEAQKLDLLSVRSFPVGSNWILEARVTVVTNADANAADLNIGVANGTHASDADSITESNFFHFDMGADLNLDAESDDGTTEVAATDTTVDWAVGTPIYLTIDGRDHTDIQMYVDGVLVLGATTFTLSAATGPLKALFHLEKTADDTPGEVRLEELRVRIQDD